MSCHKIVAGKAAVAAQPDFGLRPGLTNESNNACNILFRAGRSIDIGRPVLKQRSGRRNIVLAGCFGKRDLRDFTDSDKRPAAP